MAKEITLTGNISKKLFYVNKIKEVFFLWVTYTFFLFPKERKGRVE